MTEKLKADWNKANLLNKVALMDDYSLIDDGKWIEGEWDSEQRGVGWVKRNPIFEQYDFISEGDSPSFLYPVDNGLRNAEDPTYGGWGGRFGPYDENGRANHAPKVAVKEGLNITARSAKSRRTWTRSFTSTSSRSPMIIEVQDNGKHNLKHYQRVIITVK